MADPGHRTGLDWQAAAERLERLRADLARGEEPAPEEVARILEERARALARPLAAPADAAAHVELILFAIADERWAIERDEALEVLPARRPTPVPGAPAAIAGILHHRGRLLAVVDLRALAGEPGGREPGPVVVAEAGGVEVGLAADAVHGVFPVRADELQDAPRSEGRATCLRAVTADGAALLDLAALLRHPRVAAGTEPR